MWQSLVPIGQASSEISRQKKKEERKKHQQQNIMAVGDHNYIIIIMIINCTMCIKYDQRTSNTTLILPKYGELSRVSAAHLAATPPMKQ